MDPAATWRETAAPRPPSPPRVLDDARRKIIASVCHGPWVLISAGIVRNRRVTCYAGCKDDLINAGARYADAPVLVDENLVTAPHFRNNPEWMRETLAAYSRLQPAQA